MCRISSFEFFTIPQANLRYDLSHYELTGTMALEYAYTPSERTDKKSATNNYLEASFESPETVFQPSVTFYRLNTYARPEAEIQQKSERVNQTIDAGLDWAPGRVTFRSGYLLVSTRYDADEFYQDVSLAEKLNFDFSVPNVGMAYQLSPLTEIAGRVEFGDYNFILAPERNGTVPAGHRGHIRGLLPEFERARQRWHSDIPVGH